jgi:hypothetical protein
MLWYARAMSRFCAVHGASEATTGCGACGAPMCERCFRFLVAERPSCVRCAHEVATRARRRTSLAVTVCLVALSAGWVVFQRSHEKLWQATGAMTALLGTLTAGGLIWSQGPLSPSVRKRGPHDAAIEQGCPRRAAALRRRLITSLGPRLSARATALTVLGSMVLTAVSFPGLLGLPRWLEFELVLAVWWLLSAPALTLLLYRGFHIEDDHFFHAPGSSGLSGLRKLDGCDAAGCDFPGCDDGLVLVLVPLAALLALVLVVAVAWMVVEVVLPAAFLVFYLGTLAGLQRVARDRHDCRGSLARSLSWGALWATACIAPLASVLWLLHVLARPGVAGAELKDPSGVSFRECAHARAVPREHSCESDIGRGSLSAAGATVALACNPLARIHSREPGR